MAPRTILYTGKGGVGKTSVAAATARRCAAAGLRTVVISTDPAHSLSDVLEAPLGPDPTPVGDKLAGQEVQAQRELERHWGAVQEWLSQMLVGRGMDRIAAEELTVPPGMDELFGLLAIRRLHDDAEVDVVVVDCAPTGETLRLLSFPDVASWWLERVLPWERRLAAAARPLARGFLDAPIPSEDVFGEVQRLARELVAVNDILRDRDRASIRLVTTPDRIVVDEARRTFTYLGLYGYGVDAVIANRVLPEELDGSYLGSWRERQHDELAAMRRDFHPVPVLEARFFETEVSGPAMLERLSAELWGDATPDSVLHRGPVPELRAEGRSAVLSLPVPLADRGSVELKKVGSELVVRIGTEKRTIMLPSTLSEHRPAGARLEGGFLHVSFEDARPEPAGIG